MKSNHTCIYWVSKQIVFCFISHTGSYLENLVSLIFFFFYTLQEWGGKTNMWFMPGPIHCTLGIFMAPPPPPSWFGHVFQTTDTVRWMKTQMTGYLLPEFHSGSCPQRFIGALCHILQHPTVGSGHELGRPVTGLIDGFGNEAAGRVPYVVAVGPG